MYSNYQHRSRGYFRLSFGLRLDDCINYSEKRMSMLKNILLFSEGFKLLVECESILFSMPQFMKYILEQ